MIKLFRKIRQKLLSENNFSKYLLYAVGEIALVMIGILMALQVNNWKEAQSNKISEQKILSEIRNGLWRDLSDFEGNINSNIRAINGGMAFIKFVNNYEISKDSINYYYNYLFRDFTPVINKSGYESLKSSGLKTISNDSLRFQIVELYDYYYTIIENNTSQQSEDLIFRNYSGLIKKLYPFLEFDDNGQIISISKPSLSDLDRKEFLSYLKLVIDRREYVIRRYYKVIEHMKKLSVSIDKELDQFIPPEQLAAYLGTYQMISNDNVTQDRSLKVSVDNGYLMVYNSHFKLNKSFYMISPGEFESLILLNESGNKLSLKFTRDLNNNISHVTLVHPGGFIRYKKITKG